MLRNMFLLFALLTLTLATDTIPASEATLNLRDMSPVPRGLLGGLEARDCPGSPADTFCCGATFYCYNGEDCCSSGLCCAIGSHCCPGGGCCLDGTTCTTNFKCSLGGVFTTATSKAPASITAPPVVSSAVVVETFTYYYTITWYVSFAPEQRAHP